MLRVGLTGGIGSGKSTISSLFAVLGIPVYDTDSAAKRLMETDLSLISAIKDTFGKEACPNELPDRKYLADIVFHDRASLKKLNSIVHPAVARDFEKWVDAKASEGYPYIIHESAILFESGFDQHVDYSVTVSAPIDIRIKRAAERDAAKADEVRARMANQMDDAERESRADYIINNDGSVLLMPQIEKLDKIFRDESRG